MNITARQGTAENLLPEIWACMYLRQNATQEFIGDMRDTSQPTISRYVAELVPVVKAVLEEFVPSAEEAIEMVRGRVRAPARSVI